MDSTCDADNYRQLFGIIWGCLVTIVASTWVSVHHNVPAPGQSWFTLMLSRLGMMLVAVLAPELIVFFAARQLRVAWVFSEKYGISITHGFFISMGGFVSRVGHHPNTTIAQLEDSLLGPQYQSDIRAVDREEIRDRSKGDGLSKGVALLQGLWFIAQVLARLLEHLPTSALEIATLAYAVVNIFTWLLWWWKPLDVKTPILIGPTRADHSLHRRHSEPITRDCYLSRRRSEPITFPPTSRAGVVQFDLGSPASWHRYPKVMLVGPGDERKPADWGPAYDVPLETLEIRRRSEWAETLFAGPIQGSYQNYLPRTSKSVPEFWSSPDIPRYSPFGAMLVGMVFGAIHCAAWAESFPSTAEMNLWRASAVVVAAYPAVLVLIHVLGEAMFPGHVHAHVPVITKVLGVAISFWHSAPCVRQRQGG
ncbi:hypothetical protein DFH09DRAFT_906342 [Mycena vulgaris]|nr:hypothetical protein DFH09DRAFT_906342 [Mycena vulgaris]